jgi:hypothetical protein
LVPQTILADAILSIQCANDAALRRRNALRSRRYPIELVDNWLTELENLMEHEDPVVPEPLIIEIAAFLGRLDPRLYRRLWSKGKRATTNVLDTLFEVEEVLLLRVSAIA